MGSINQFLSEILSPQTGHLDVWHALAAIGVAYLGGVLSSLTPCVYPMIPITVGVVGGMGGSRKWREVCFRGLAYVAGMTVVYSFLGVIAGISGRIFGSLTNNWSWYLGLGAVLSIAALIMLDVLPFDPTVWIEQVKRKLSSSHKKPSPTSPLIKKEMTLLGAFFLGASSGFIAAPCTTPVLTAILGFIAKTQSVGLGFLLMFAFSLGLGTLLLIVAAFTGAVQVLPRSGQWMKTIKTLSGLILLAFAEYLIYRAGSFGGP